MERSQPARVEVARPEESAEDRTRGSTKAVGVVPLADLLAKAIVDARREPERIDQRAALLKDQAMGVLLVLGVNASVAVKPVGCLRNFVQRIGNDVMKAAALRHELERHAKNLQRIAHHKRGRNRRGDKHCAVDSSCDG